MKRTQHTLLVEHMDMKSKSFKKLETASGLNAGWIRLTRQALGMSLRQLASRMNISIAAVKAFETNEAKDSITINSLKKAAGAMGMRFVYGFAPIEKNINQMIEERALEMAEDIVMRTSANMALEGKANNDERLKKAITEMAQRIKYEMPRKLWG